MPEPPRQRGRGPSERWAELSPVPSRGQGDASHHNFGYRERGRTSEVTGTFPKRGSGPRSSQREYAAVRRNLEAGSERNDRKDVSVFSWADQSALTKVVARGRPVGRSSSWWLPTVWAAQAARGHEPERLLCLSI